MCRKQGDRAMDRISCLPDEIICHVLSFLPTKPSIQTSVLSKRWKFLWAHVPSFEYHADDIPTSDIYFPFLKKLKLHCFGYESHESISHLISSCPVLEELIMVGNWDDDCCVSSPTLTRLVLQFDNDEILHFSVKLDTPALRYLRLRCFMPGIFSVGALDSLVEADISLYWDRMHQDNYFSWCYLLAFVGKLSNVRLLRLSTHGMPVIYDAPFSDFAVKFHNLTKLDLSSNLGLITSFLENSNNLQDLEFDVLVIDEQNYWVGPKQVPPCLISNLRTIKVGHFGCSREEFDMVRYILMNTKVLQRMEIQIQHYKDDWEEKFEKVQRIRSFARGSQECQVVFDWDYLKDEDEI